MIRSLEHSTLYISPPDPGRRKLRPVPRCEERNNTALQHLYMAAGLSNDGDFVETLSKEATLWYQQFKLNRGAKHRLQVSTSRGLKYLKLTL